MGPFSFTHSRQWCGDVGSQKTEVSQMATVCLSSDWPPSPLAESVAFADQWNGLSETGLNADMGRALAWDWSPLLRSSFVGQSSGLCRTKTRTRTDLYSCKTTQISCHLINAYCSWLVGFLYHDSLMLTDVFQSFLPNKMCDLPEG